MSLADPRDVLGAVAQLQYLVGTDSLKLGLNARWLPSSLRHAAKPRDVCEVLDSLHALLRVDLGRICAGREIPPQVLDHLRTFDRAVVNLHFSAESWKVELADELLPPLLEELNQLGIDLRDADGEEPGYVAPTWLKLYRSMLHRDSVGKSVQSEVCRMIGRLSTDRQGFALALLTVLVERAPQDDLPDLVHRLTDTERKRNGCWDSLFNRRVWELLRGQKPPRQAELAAAWIDVVAEDRAEAMERVDFMANIFRLPKPEPFCSHLLQLGNLTRRSGLADEIVELTSGDGVIELPTILSCLSADSARPATLDAQRLIAKILQKHRCGRQTEFQAFCRRIRGVELSARLRSELYCCLLSSETHLLGAAIERNLDVEGLTRRARAEPMQHRQLCWLLVIAIQHFEDDELREITRSLSLIDVAMHQAKVDQHHSELLFEDMLRSPLESLTGLARGRRLKGVDSASQRLQLLYLTLSVSTETLGRIAGVDLDDLSATLRRLRAYDQAMADSC